MTKIPDDMTELVDATIDRVDLVGAAANGARFLIAKSADESAVGLIPADTVRDLLKAADGEESDALDVTQVLAEDTGNLEPGSAEWEYTDSATAAKWTAILIRAKNALGVLADREDAEDDWDNKWNLRDAADAVDCAIGILAQFAAEEAFEAEDIQEITKAAAAINTDELATVEAYGAVLKAGRTLSAANETSLRNAADAIQKVLASLPAPAEPVTKEAPVANELTADAGITVSAPAGEARPVVKAEPVVEPAEEVTKTEQLSEPEPVEPEEQPETDVVKAGGLIAVYDRNGLLVGAVKPGSITSLTEPATEAPEEAAAEPADEEDAPAEGVAKNVTKAEDTGIAALLKAALEPLTAQLAGMVTLAETVEVLKGQVETLGREPDDRKSPLLNGATGTPGAVSRDGSETDSLAPLRKAVAEAKTHGEKVDAEANLGYAAVFAALTAN